MDSFKKTSIYLFFFLAFFAGNAFTVKAAADAEEPFNPKTLIFGHIGDAYEWHVFTVKEHHISIPLPIIVKSRERGWYLFPSSKLSHGETYEGFRISKDPRFSGKVVEVLPTGEEQRPFDLSFTKNACSIFISSFLLVILVLSFAAGYKKEPLKSKKGLFGVMEMLYAFIYDDLIQPCVGKHYKKYGPYLLTVFFFIFLNNLLGLVPLFPGGANITGNIGITLVLAVLTFLITNFSGTREYWKEVFWPDVPTWLKIPLPLMPLVEIVGIITKPFSLMMRLFANMLAGHMIVLVLMSLIFIFSAMGISVAAGVSVISVLFSIFILLIDVLVSFIQAYVFTMLSAIFIGMAKVEPHHQHEVSSKQEEKIQLTNLNN